MPNSPTPYVPVHYARGDAESRRAYQRQYYQRRRDLAAAGDVESLGTAEEQSAARLAAFFARRVAADSCYDVYAIAPIEYTTPRVVTDC